MTTPTPLRIGDIVHFRQSAVAATDSTPAVTERCVPAIVVDEDLATNTLTLSALTPTLEVCADVEFDYHATDETGYTAGAWHPIH